jgi:ubiquinone/menaquinone biosynthesis C-methylase UbiE
MLYFVLILWICYNYLIKTYFVINDTINYDCFLKYFIQVASKDNYYMNYGLWLHEDDNLLQANKNLVNFIIDLVYQENKESANKPSANKPSANKPSANKPSANKPPATMQILDVGCGYGYQDFDILEKFNNKVEITAIDISQKQIDFATEYRNTKNISDKQISFQVGDAMKLRDKYKKNQFDIIFSIESAFHYKDRPLFFKNVSEILKNNGSFVISDIVLNNKKNPLNLLTLKFFKDFLHIPNQNLITEDKWKKQLTENFKIIKEYNLSDKIFTSYYTHFLKEFCKKRNIPKCIETILIKLFVNIQPFSYVVALGVKTPDTPAG